MEKNVRDKEEKCAKAEKAHQRKNELVQTMENAKKEDSQVRVWP